jgi:hypothetical protein
LDARQSSLDSQEPACKKMAPRLLIGKEGYE